MALIKTALVLRNRVQKNVKAKWHLVSDSMMGMTNPYASTQVLSMYLIRKNKKDAEKIAKQAGELIQSLELAERVKGTVSLDKNISGTYSVRVVCKGPKKAKRSSLPYYD